MRNTLPPPTPRVEHEGIVVIAAVLVLAVAVVWAIARYSHGPPVSPLATPVATSTTAIEAVRPVPVATPVGAIVPQAPGAQCAYNGPLPDVVCSPGLADPQMTKALVCTTRTSSRRPPANVTNPLKRQGMALYGLGGYDPADFEWDHIVSLELGGDPMAVNVGGFWRDTPGALKNGFPQPRNRITPGNRWGAEDKDWLENRLHQEVCNDTTTLAQAQHELATDWVAAALARGIQPGAQHVGLPAEP
jgi:hypothetical protein